MRNSEPPFNRNTYQIHAIPHRTLLKRPAPVPNFPNPPACLAPFHPLSCSRNTYWYEGSARMHDAAARHRYTPRRPGALFLAVLGALTCCAPAGAIQQRQSVGGIDIAVYGPDWTWQGRDINVLIVFTNPSDTPVAAEAALRMPPDSGAAFGRFGQPHEWAEDDLARSVTIPPRAAVREAFAGITALSDAPLGDYALALDLAVGETRDAVAYPVRIVRGAAVRGGRWAALAIPAAIALVWCAAFVIVLSRQARPGAWRTPPPAMDEPANAPAWIKEARP